MKSAWEWACDHAVALLSLTIALLAAYAGVQLWRKRAGSLKDEVQVLKAQREIAGLRARRELLDEQSEEKSEEIQALDKALLDNKRRIVSAHQRVEEMPDEQIEDEFRKLGY